MTSVSPRPRFLVAPVVLVIVVLLTGLGLYFWLAPRTPVVAVPAAEPLDP